MSLEVTSYKELVRSIGQKATPILLLLELAIFLWKNQAILEEESRTTQARLDTSTTRRFHNDYNFTQQLRAS
jgi:hypothetical protein